MGFAEKVSSIRWRYPEFQVKSYRDHWLFRILWDFFNVRRTATTIGMTVYMDPKLLGTSSGAEVLRHEEVHVEDQDLHPIWFFFSYIFLPPIGPGMKAHWEWRAYQEDLMESCERLKRVEPRVIDWVVNEFTGPDYLWMYPFRSKMEKRCIDFCTAYLKILPQ